MEVRRRKKLISLLLIQKEIWYFSNSRTAEVKTIMHHARFYSTSVNGTMLSEARKYGTRYRS